MSSLAASSPRLDPRGWRARCRSGWRGTSATGRSSARSGPECSTRSPTSACGRARTPPAEPRLLPRARASGQADVLERAVVPVILLATVVRQSQTRHAHRRARVGSRQVDPRRALIATATAQKRATASPKSVRTKFPAHLARQTVDGPEHLAVGAGMHLPGSVADQRVVRALRSKHSPALVDASASRPSPASLAPRRQPIGQNRPSHDEHRTEINDAVLPVEIGTMAGAAAAFSAGSTLPGDLVGDCSNGPDTPKRPRSLLSAGSASAPETRAVGSNSGCLGTPPPISRFDSL